MTATKKAATVSETITDKFTKEQLKKSKKYRDNIDVLSVVLEEGQTYSFEETDKLIDKYLKEGVK